MIQANARRALIRREIWKHRYLYILLLLPIAYFILFKFVPLYGMQIAFRDYRVRRGIWGSDWTGIMHFAKYMREAEFWKLVRNTLTLGFESVAFTFPIPIIFAILLNEVPSKRAQRLIQNITYLPHFISVVVVASMLTTFLASDGLINQLGGFFGKKPYVYMQDPRWFRPIYIISGVWQGMGWNAIIYCAALTGVDEQLYEAAIVDGANRWKQTIHVTLPAIVPTISIMLILAMGNVMSVSFEKVLLLQNALTYETSDVISTYVYRKGLTGGQYSYSTAIDMFSTVTNFLFIITANTICRRLGETSLW